MNAPLATLLTDAILARAWARVRRSPGAGLDGVTAARFEVNLDRDLNALRRELLEGRYRPGPLLRREIPKASGGVRTLGIPTVRDRLAQAMILESAGRGLDARLSPHAHGYRPGRSPATAIADLTRQIGQPEWLELVHADVHGLFEHLPHDRLLSAARRAWPDPIWSALVQTWLRAWAEAPGRGVPQGAPMSPLLANLCLAEHVDAPLEAARRIRPHTVLYRTIVTRRYSSLTSPSVAVLAWIRYGDDLVVASGARASGPALLATLDALIRAAGLRLSESKTVLSPGALAGRPLPRPVLGVPLSLCPTGAKVTKLTLRKVARSGLAPSQSSSPSVIHAFIAQAVATKCPARIIRLLRSSALVGSKRTVKYQPHIQPSATADSARPPPTSPPARQAWPRPSRSYTKAMAPNAPIKLRTTARSRFVSSGEVESMRSLLLGSVLEMARGAPNVSRNRAHPEKIGDQQSPGPDSRG